MQITKKQIVIGLIIVSLAVGTYITVSYLKNKNKVLKIVGSKTPIKIYEFKKPIFAVQKSNDFISKFGKIDDVPNYLTKVKVPYTLYYGGSPIDTVTCHKAVADKFLRIMNRTLAYYGKDKIKKLKLDQYGGCYNKRATRGTEGNPVQNWSVHSWGVAFDFAPEYNQLNWKSDKALFAKPEYQKFIQFWYDEGAYNQGVEKDNDWMHFQFARYK